MIKELDIQNIVPNLIPFFNIIDRLFDFTDTMIQHYSLKSTKEIEETNNRLDKQMQKFKELRTKFSHIKDEALRSKIQDLITKTVEFTKEVKDSKLTS